MNYTLKRISDNGKSTIGYLSADKFKCFTLEDEYREEKVKRETRIPAGRYRVKLKRVLTGLTKKYREKHPWFTWHLELQNVPNFTSIYIHVGNFETQTEGCILVGMGAMSGDKQSIQQSVVAFKDLYQEMIKLRS